MKTKRKRLKEAAKVFEYTTAVERGLQAAEILQASSVSNATLRQQQLLEAGVTELKRVRIAEGKLRLVISVLSPVAPEVEAEGSSLPSEEDSAARSKRSKSEVAAERMRRSKPQRFGSREIVIAVTEESGGGALGVAQLLRLMSRDSAYTTLLATSTTAESAQTLIQEETPEVHVQSVFLSLASKALSEVREFLGNLSAPTSGNATLENGAKDQLTSAPERIWLVGHSAGGAVAALAAVILDGGVQRPVREGTEAPTEEEKGSNCSLKSVSDLLGAFPSRVRCTALGPPPCLSRVAVPRYINAFVCGDDVVPRAHPDALRALRTRVASALQSGAGRKSSLGYMLGTGIISDLSSLAGG
jgi:hypothetical protein